MDSDIDGEGGLFYIGGQAGSVYSTVYREAIPETAQLTETGDSQVLVLYRVYRIVVGWSIYSYTIDLNMSILNLYLQFF